MVLELALLILTSTPQPSAPEPKAPVAPATPEVKLPVVPGVDGGVKGEPRDGGAMVELVGHADAGAPAAPGEPKPEGGLVERRPDAPPKKNLCGELVKTGKELAAAKARLAEERKVLEQDWMALEKMKAEIADARIQLRVETERLERLLAKRAEQPEAGATTAGPSAQAASGTKPSVTLPRTEELDALAKTMRSMKPDAAAALVQKTELTLAAAVLRRMRPADSGAIMDRLRPDLAAELLAVMATLPPAPAKGARL